MISPKLLLIVSMIFGGVLGLSDPNAPVPSSRDGAEIEVPEECKKIGICEQSAGYKDDVVDFVIPNLLNNNTNFNVDVLEPPELESRNAADVEVLCPSRSQIYAPKLAQDAQKKWFRILNSDSNAQQLFRIEICLGDIDSPCSSVAVMQEGYQSRCVQKYVMRNMYALDSKNEIIQKAFQVPNCCSCAAKTLG